MLKRRRTKDVHGNKIGEGSSTAHVVQKNPPKSHKKKFQQELKQKSNTPFKKKNKKRKIILLVASMGTMLESVRRLSGSQTRK
jgi:hypothetical protein